MARGQTRESVKMALDTLRTNKLRSGPDHAGHRHRREHRHHHLVGDQRREQPRERLGELPGHQRDLGVPHAGDRRAARRRRCWRARSSPSTTCMALRTLPHVVAADGGYQHVGQFRVGAVSVKYDGKKMAGTMLQGSDRRSQRRSTDLTLLAGPHVHRRRRSAGRACVRARPRHMGGALRRARTAIGKEVNVETGLYTVIGVLDKQKQPFGGGKNPATTWSIFPWARSITCIPKTRTCG